LVSREKIETVHIYNYLGAFAITITSLYRFSYSPSINYDGIMSTIWIPQPKVIKGKEEEYTSLTNKILDIYQTDEVVVDDSNSNPEVKQLLEQRSAITISPYQTLNIPEIGQNEAANEYFLQKFKEVYPKKFDPEEVLEKASGHYAIGMVMDAGGISVYRPQDGEIIDFDTDLLVNCLPLIGPEILLSSAFDKTAEQAKEFGEQLKAITDDLISKHNIGYLRDQKEKPNEDAKDGHKMVHYLLAASSWLVFWGSNGHGIEAKADLTG